LCSPLLHSSNMGGCSSRIEKESVDTLQSEADGRGINIQAGSTIMAEHRREPMLLLDTTGSMTFPTSENDRKERHETVHDAVSTLVSEMCKLDTQAKRKRRGAGLRTVTFAGDKAHDIGDLRPDNIRAKWEKLEWMGSTHIMSGWRKLLAVHEKEWGRNNDILLLALVITDGQAEDTKEFEEHLMSLHGRVFVVLAIVGYGKEHDQAYAEYRQIEANNKLGHLRVVPLADAPNQGQYIADVMRGFLQADDLHVHDFRDWQQQQESRQSYTATGPSMPRGMQPMLISNSSSPSYAISSNSATQRNGNSNGNGGNGPPSYAAVFN